jgi:hypothetical protein
MNQRETDTSEQVLKFAPKEKAPNRVAQLDDAGQAIVAQIRTAADLAKEDCDRAMSLAHKLSGELRGPKIELSKWRGRLSTGKNEQHAPNNGFGRFSKRLKRSCFLGGRPQARKRPQSVSSDPTSPPVVPARWGRTKGLLMNLLLLLLLALPFACLAVLSLVAFLRRGGHRWRSSCDRHDHFGAGYRCSKRCRPVARGSR